MIRYTQNSNEDMLFMEVPPLRILVVEDTKDMNLLIVKTLKKAGYSVDGCFDGEEAKLHLLGAE